MLNIVFLGDLHCGSHVGLAKPGDPNPQHELNPVQQALYDAYASTVKAWRKPDILIVNGDVVDGQGRAAKATEQWTSQWVAQTDEATALLDMWGAKHIFVVRGTAYHVRVDGFPVEELIARNLDAEPYPEDTGDGIENPRSGWHWYITAGGLTMHVAHKTGVSRVWHYRSTAITREMLLAKLNDRIMRETVGHVNTDLVVRSHVHYYWYVEAASQMGLVLPCWQAQSPFMAWMSANGMTPDIGAVRLRINAKGAITREKRIFKLHGVQRAPHSTVVA